MVANVMSAMPESGQNDLLKSVKGNMPETTRKLLPLFELIEKSPPTIAPKGGDNAKGKSNQGDGATKKHSADNLDLRVPRKKARFQYNKCKHLRNKVRSLRLMWLISVAGAMLMEL
jgi:hypothetical protein